ncbi:MAG: sigma-54-dependent Fis family transcriptional regulator, partial [candidate division Zixibacteria bacterium]|nr:sigma-54-dependent Fis family transcriptional regulator [candidate division Zixibacteria bacterium]
FNKAIPIDIRLICATNLSIYEMVDNNRFRQDLLYRINTVEIKLPPLRERVEDIALLVKHFLKIYRKKYNKPISRIHVSTLARLEKYAWPGNVRELQHAVERAVIMCDADILRPKDFFLSAPRAHKDELILEKYNLDEVEKTVIKKALVKHKGNVSHAARELGLTRTSLYRRMQKYDL